MEDNIKNYQYIKKNNKNNKSNITHTAKVARRNHEITAKEIQVISADERSLGKMTVVEALGLALQDNLDLVEVSPQADPPVCRIMDYGKYLFQQNKKGKFKAVKHKNSVKQLRFGVNIGEEDYQVKVRKILEFLNEGSRVKILLRFRGREMQHQEFGTQLLERLIRDVGPQSTVEQAIKFETKQLLTVVFAPQRGRK